MKKDIGVICVSSAYLSKKYVEENDIEVVNLSVVIDGEAISEDEIESNEFLFEKMNNGSTITTSQPNPELFLNAINKQAKKYSKIIIFSLSSGLSGSYNSACLAANLYEGDCEIEVIDTLTAAMGLQACVENVIDNDSSTFSDVVSKVKEYIVNSKTYLSIDDLSTLVKTGRMKFATAVIGNVLKIKPMLVLDEQGKINVYEKIRTQKKLLLKFAELAGKMSPKKIYVTYVGDHKYADELKLVFQEQLKNVEIIICEEVGPVLSVHLGKGGLGVFVSKNA